MLLSDVPKMPHALNNYTSCLYDASPFDRTAFLYTCRANPITRSREIEFSGKLYGLTYTSLRNLQCVLKHIETYC